MPSILDLALQVKNARGLDYKTIAAEAGIGGKDAASNLQKTFKRRKRLHAALADWVLEQTFFSKDPVTRAVTELEAAGLNPAQLAGVRTLLESYGFRAQTSAASSAKAPGTLAVPSVELRRYVSQLLTEREARALFEHAVEATSGRPADHPLHHALTVLAILLSDALALRTRREREDVLLEARAAGATDG